MRATLTLSRDFAMHPAIRRIAQALIVCIACLLIGIAVSGVGLWLCWAAE